MTIAYHVNGALPGAFLLFENSDLLQVLIDLHDKLLLADVWLVSHAFLTKLGLQLFHLEIADSIAENSEPPPALGKLTGVLD